MTLVMVMMLLPILLLLSSFTTVFSMVLVDSQDVPASAPVHSPAYPPQQQQHHHHHHHHHSPSPAPAPLHVHHSPAPPTHHHYPPTPSPAKPPVHHHHHHSPTPAPVAKPPVHHYPHTPTPAPVAKPPVHHYPPTPTPAPAKPKPPVHTPVPVVHPPFPRSFVAVQGVVYVKSCKYAGADTLLGAVPLLGADVKLQCNNTRYKLVQKATTDKNGYFFIEAPKTITTYGAHKCNVVLVSAGYGLKPSNLHGGLTGAVLRPEKPYESKKLPFFLYTVGPLAFEPNCPH